MLLSSKTSIITGCNKGIGKSILEEFSKNGANIFACTKVLNKEFHSLTSEIEKKYNNKIIPIEINLTDEESVKEGAKKILSYDVKIDILINNAASIFSSVFQMTSIKKYKELFNINFHSQVLLTQFIIKYLI